jgi:putative methionine-R-sulfoxide reductase with GAF domain
MATRELDANAKTQQTAPNALPVRNTHEQVLKALHAAAEICRCAQSPLPVLTKAILAAAKSVTGASWAELLLLHGETLMVCPSGQDAKFTMQQVRQTFQVTTGSLAGLVATTGKAKNFTSPQTSAFYKNSTYKLTPFAPGSLRPEDTWAVAGLPICDGNASTVGVLIIFNKKDEKSPQTFFTSSDTDQCKEICDIIGSIFDTRKSSDWLKDELQRFQQFFNERIKFTDQFTADFGRKKRQIQFLKFVKTHVNELSVTLVELMTQILCVDAVIIHVAREGRLKPRMAVGIHLEDYNTRTSAYVAFTTKEALNIHEVSTEPLYSGYKIHMKAALCCPLIQYGATIAVFELFRRTSVFTELDMTILNKTLEALSHVPVRYYERYFPGQSPAPSRSPIINSIVRYFTLFSLPRKGEIFDYVNLINSAEATLKRLVKGTTSAVYLCDEVRNLIWTRKSNSCDPLTFTRTEDSLLGYLSTLQTTTLFPLPEELLGMSGAEYYAKCKGCCYPIKRVWMGMDHVMGMVMVTKEEKLTEKEMERVGSMADILGNFLMVLFFDRSYKKSISSNSGIYRRSSSFLEVNVAEKVLKRERTEGKLYEISGDERCTVTPWTRLLPALTSIPADMLAQIYALCAALEDAKNPFKLVAEQLAVILPCDVAKLYMYNADRMVLIDQGSGSDLVPSGLIKECITSKSTIVLGSDINENPNFDPITDSLGRQQPLASWAAAPILCFGNQPEGIVVFINFSPRLSLSEVKSLASLLSCLIRDILIVTDKTALNWRNLAQSARRQKMLFKWCEEIFRVLILSQEKAVKCSFILNRLQMSPQMTDLLAIALNTVALILNAEGARLLIKRSGVAAFAQFTQEGGLSELQTELNLELKRVFERGTALSSGPQPGYSNSLVLPVNLEQETVALVEVWNKRDEMHSTFVDFGASDEAVVQAICDTLGEPCQALFTKEAGRVFPDLVAVLKERVWATHNYSLINTIRKACKSLLDCDRASIFLVEGDNLVIRPQGNDSEIPVGITIPIGVGIVGSVAKEGKALHLEDVYQDPRFNPSVDMKTGYRTRTMLCVPVISQGRVIAVLQMINKSNGLFDSTDMEMLQTLSSLAASAVQSLQLFQALISEMKMYTDVLNSLGCAIVVLRNGHLDFSNRSIEQLLGVSEAFALSHDYSLWPSLAPVLRTDIDLVLKNAHKSARKRFQLLQQKDTDGFRYDYRVIPVEDEASLERKLMLVFEEVTNRTISLQPPSLNKSRVQSETTLQTCINQLSEVMQQTTPEVKSSLEFVVHTLKSGNLNRTKVVMEEEALASSIDPEILQQSPMLPNLLHSMTFSEKLEGIVEIEEMPVTAISLEELRSWNLDFTTVASEYPYILAMFQDFGFVKTFKIEMSAFQAFLQELKMYYNHRRNPFHNYMHACSVMHNIYCLLACTAAGQLYENWELFSFLLAAIGHDIDHTARTNAFETSKGSDLAIRYHDTSVLEQHHAAMLFLTIQKPHCDFLSSLDPAVRRQIRKFIIPLILATDMSKHMTMVANMQARFKELAEDSLGSRPNDKREAGELLIHCADLSNPTKTFEISLRWSRCLAQEFEAQVAEEEQLQLPVTTFMQDLHRPAVFLKNEVGFYSVIVRPLWECLGMWLTPGTDLALAQLSDNIEKLKKMQEEAAQA